MGYKVGFIGLGNVGSKLAGCLLRNGAELTVHELDKNIAQPFLDKGASWADSPKEMAEKNDFIITCLPSPASCSAVTEGENGILEGITAGKIWMEMSTTDAEEVKRIGKKFTEKGAFPVDCPVSGGCHRAATGNIAIFAGCERDAFEKILPLLTMMGRRVLHTGDIGSASLLKVVTNYLATANLLSLAEAMTVCAAQKMNLNVAYEAIRISSGNSFVHETETQVTLNGSRDINFTLDLVLKDISLFQQAADNVDLPLEISPLLIDIITDGIKKYGEREWSPNIIKRLEEKAGVQVLASGFPAEMTDDEPEERGYEIRPKGL